MSRITTPTFRRVKSLATLGAILAAVLVTSGCLEGSAVRTGIYLPPKSSYAPIDVYMGDDPYDPWEEVGRVSAKGTGPHADLYDVVAVLKDQARGLGADAIIVTESWTEDDVWYDDYGYEHVYSRTYAKGIAIYFL